MAIFFYDKTMTPPHMHLVCPCYKKYLSQIGDHYPSFIYERLWKTNKRVCSGSPKTFLMSLNRKNDNNIENHRLDFSCLDWVFCFFFFHCYCYYGFKPMFTSPTAWRLICTRVFARKLVSGKLSSSRWWYIFESVSSDCV